MLILIRTLLVLPLVLCVPGRTEDLAPDRLPDSNGHFPFFKFQPGEMGNKNCARIVATSPSHLILGDKITDRSEVKFLYSPDHINHLGVGKTPEGTVSLVSPLSEANTYVVEWRNSEGKRLKQTTVRIPDGLDRFTIPVQSISSHDGMCTVFQGHTRHPIVAYNQGRTKALAYLAPPSDLAPETNSTGDLVTAVRWNAGKGEWVQEEVMDDELHTVATLIFNETGPKKHILTVTNFGDVTLWENQSGVFRPTRLRTGIARPFKEAFSTGPALDLGGNGEVSVTYAERIKNVVTAALSPDNKKMVLAVAPGLFTQFSVQDYFPAYAPDSGVAGDTVAVELRSLNNYRYPDIIGFLEGQNNAYFIASSERTSGLHAATTGWETAARRPTSSHSEITLYRRDKEASNPRPITRLIDHPGASVRNVFHTSDRLVTVSDDPDSKIRIFRYSEKNPKLMTTLSMYSSDHHESAITGVNGPLDVFTTAVLSPQKTHLLVGTSSKRLLSIRLSDGKVVAAKYISIVASNETVVQIVISQDHQWLFVQTLFGMYRVPISALVK